MATVYLVGAGASVAYDRSRFGVRPPLARSFFEAYTQLPISEDFNVKVGNIVNFARDHYGVPQKEFVAFREDIEAFMVRVDQVIEEGINELQRSKTNEVLLRTYQAQRAKFELLLLFSRVLADTTDGPPCPYYGRLVECVRPGDTIISFNWDTLMDRALHSSQLWSPDDGYGVTFDRIFDFRWRKTVQKPTSKVLLLKLHGSINWLVCLPGVEFSTGKPRSSLPTERYHDKFCFVRGDGEPHYAPRHVYTNPLAPKQRADGLREITANIRIVPKTAVVRGLEDVQLIPDVQVADGYAASSKMTPLIIPPTHRKNYDDLPGQVFEELWPKALQAIVEADKLVIIGYSFPKTDERSRWVVQQSFSLRASPLRIELVNPNAAQLKSALEEVAGSSPCRIMPVADSFQSYIRQLVAT